MRILVIEDQKKMLNFLRRGLEENGYSVDVAESGGAGEAMAFENSYDMIVLDVMLPDKNGMDVARSIRSDSYTGPILMLTALSRTKDKVSGLDAGADDYLTKPFAFEELLARIRALLRRKGEGSTTQLNYADLKLDVLKRTAWRGDVELALTQKEFSLLEYFLRNPQRPVSRTELSEHVWDVHFDPESNVIDVYVSMLRKKMELGSSSRLIHTVVGAGYVLKEAD